MEFGKKSIGFLSQGPTLLDCVNVFTLNAKYSYMYSSLTSSLG